MADFCWELLVVFIEGHGEGWNEGEMYLFVSPGASLSLSSCLWELMLKMMWRRERMFFELVGAL